MPVIKCNKSQAIRRDAIVLDLSDIERQGRALLEEARRQADQMLRDAEHKAGVLASETESRARERGWQEGHAAGLEEGRSVGRAEALRERHDQIAALTEQWSNALVAWDSERQAMLTEARQDVLHLALALAKKIVHRSVDTMPDVIVDQVAAALSHVQSPSAVVVCVNPEDREILSVVLDDITSTVDACEHVTLQDDPTIARGGCRVRMSGGAIDATIERQLDRIVSTLLPSQEPGVREGSNDKDDGPAEGSVTLHDGGDELE